MAKKKKEHVVFDNMLAPKKAMPFAQTNKMTGGKSISKVSPKSFNRRTP